MRTRSWRRAAALAILAGAPLARAAVPPLAAFVGLNSVTDVTISPDGRYLALLVRRPEGPVALVRDLSEQGRAPHPVMASSLSPQRVQIEWCRWATERRLLCGLRGVVDEGGLIYVATRLAAVDADGKNMKVLVANSAYGESQFQDEIIDWNPGKAGSVLIQGDESLEGSTSSSDAAVYGQTSTDYPGVQELNVVSGAMHARVHPRPPIRRFLTDGHGEVRLGWGYFAGTAETAYYVHSRDSHDWKLLFKHQEFAEDSSYEPLAVCADRPDCVYAMAGHEGRAALWRIDLTGKQEPQLEFSHPAVNVDDPVFGPDGRLLGVEYETDRPFFYAVDAKARSLMNGVKKLLPGAYVSIHGATHDEKLFILRTSSDIDAGTFYLVDIEHGMLSRIAGGYPGFDPAALGRMQPISYPAQDGTSIPGYLTVPPGKRAEHLPLIVMPHGGPIDRDSWRFDFLRAFLVSRGYAVLQMNFRGSDGYGAKWLEEAHQDWGGLTYSDITDGARWAVKQGIADPAHMCILGWSFGGYAALLGAVRNSDLYRCSVSIAGVSDLSLLESQGARFVNSAMVRAQIGTQRDKLRNDSPRRHAAETTIPVLLIHGDRDPTVNVEQSREMDAALTHAGKKHTLVVIRNTDHQIGSESDRTTLLDAVEKFLAENLGPGAT